jgi:hypothetical protein
MVYFKVLPRHLPGVTEGKHKNPVRTVCDTVEIQIRHLLNICQNCYHFTNLLGSILKALFLILYTGLVSHQSKYRIESSVLLLNNYFIPLGPLS